jgi:hypothetical protein
MIAANGQNLPIRPEAGMHPVWTLTFLSLTESRIEKKVWFGDAALGDLAR